MASPSPAVADLPGRPQLERYFPIIVVAVAILTYAATLRFGFVYDDHQQIIENPLIRSWRTLPLLFKTDVWRFWHPAMVGNYWRPLFMCWLLLNYKLFALHAAGWHLTSILVHATASYLCYRTVKVLSAHSTIALAASLIFAVHPAHLETVAWISGVTDSLMTVFFLAAVLCFLRGYRREVRPVPWLVTSSLLFGCALLCKETAAALPAVALAYVLLLGDETPDRARKALLSGALYFAVFVIYFIARRSALAGVGHSEFQIGIATLFLTWPSLLWFYISHLFWPVGLSVLYDRVPILHPDWRHFWLPLLALLGTIIGFLYAIGRNQRRLAAFATLLFAISLAPAFLLPALFPADYAHDRYLYLPCLGFAMLCGIVIERMFSTKQMAKWVTLVLVIVALSVATSAQMVYWANDLLLFDRATKVAPGNLTAFNNLANALIQRGRTDDAVSIFRQILQANPNDWHALFNLGLYHFQTGNYTDAEGLLRRACDVKASDADTFALLADVLNRESKYAAAETAIRRALTLRPNKPGYRRVLAEALDGQGLRAQALEQLRVEVQEHPEEQQAVTLLRLLQSKQR